MKSPWKYLTQLTSRKRPADYEDRSLDDSPGQRAEEGEALQSSGEVEATLPSGTADGDEPLSDPEMDVGTPFETKDDLGVATSHLSDGADGNDQLVSKSRNDDTVDKPTPVSVSDAKSEIVHPLRPTRAGRPKKNHAKVVAKTTSALDKGQTESPIPPAPTVVDHGTELDREIKHLRNELAERLRLQNAQLRAMLERFE
ncbi:hypothetical protein [Rhizobium sp. BK399]|uniref:hypothetical protein n=1 Tax=Rhizobium sp. BK399 TaxID=2587063 RepID=UPI0016155A72|nr:hypothetical protein [Rhizobium sp. BK399]MBB3543877.1 uncharacterized protein (DUF1800 family) [Rhizobium sp. BK399]